MVARLRCVFRSTGNENPSIICLYGAESNWDVKIYVQYLPLLPLMINVVECNYLLIKLEEMDFVCHHCLYFLLILTVDHTDPCLGKVVGHCKLGVSVETDVLLVVSLRIYLWISDFGRFSTGATWSTVLVLGLAIVLIIQHLLE